MALVQKRNPKRNLILLAAAGGAVVVGLIAYFLFIAPPSSSTSSGDNQVVQRDLPIVNDFGEKIFDDPRFQSLQPYGDLPVDRGAIGRSNPFEPPSP